MFCIYLLGLNMFSHFVELKVSIIYQRKIINFRKKSWKSINVEGQHNSDVKLLHFVLLRHFLYIPVIQIVIIREDKFVLNSCGFYD